MKARARSWAKIPWRLHRLGEDAVINVNLLDRTMAAAIPPLRSAAEVTAF
jgi:hypothetical protein